MRLSNWKKWKRGLSLWMSAVLLVSVFAAAVPVPAAFADTAGQTTKITVQQAIEEAARYLKSKTDLSPGDWDTVALARAGQPVSANYVSAVEEQVRQSAGTFTRVTDAAPHRVRLGGGRPGSVAVRRL